MTYTAKDTMKKLKKVKDKPAAEKIQPNRDEESKTEDVNVPEKSFTLNKAKLRTELVAESAYISEILGLVHFPKRADSDDEGMIIFLTIYIYFLVCWKKVLTFIHFKHLFISGYLK